jgi:beta-N-acetylhexosaminidase
MMMATAPRREENPTMTATSAGTHLMLAFEGTALPAAVAATVRDYRPAGFTLFPHANVERPDQVAELAAALQRANPTELPLLIAADQETGQLIGLGPGSTPFPGNMALGAAGDPDLACEVGRAVGWEMLAMGVNVNYAPVCDVATNPANPSLGIRAFGDDPAIVATMASAMVRGLQESGVVATAKHFPGKGEAVVDPHYELPQLDLDTERLHTVELAPFRAAIEAGVGVVMSGHYSVPAVTGRADLPSTLSPAMITGLLRGELGFGGVVITDALNMGALIQGVGQVVDVIAALVAGVDLLLCTPGEDQQAVVRLAVELAMSRGLVDRAALVASAGRIASLRQRAASADRPGLDVVGCAQHRDLAAGVARRSITVVRNDAGLLPLQLATGTRILAVMAQPADLTPADTSSMVAPGLAAALRRHHADVTEVVTSHPPTPAEIGAVAEQAAHHDLVVAGTISATPEQVDLVAAAIATGTPTVTVALRTPFDLAGYPQAATHLATYSILPVSLEALAAVMFGAAPGTGRLPAAIPGLYPAGHGLTL